jgi:hypothetical protein
MTQTRQLRLTTILKGILAAAALAGLSACAPGTLAVTPLPDRPVTPTPALPSADSRAARDYYARVQANLLAQGMLRTDDGSADSPFDARVLARNFVKIALFDEYERTPNGLVARETASTLRRWSVPVRVGLYFGASVPPERQATDRARVASYLARLARETGHPISLNDTAPNFRIYIVNEDERRAMGPLIRQALPALAPADVAGLTDLPRNNYCIVYALAAGSSGNYSNAFAIIRAEHPDLLRLSCLHEEIAQGLGLANDSPEARPSIFNDDEEFALLTRQDELMLKMLYDPRLRPGMTALEATPIVEAIAVELLGGES